jgi:hypothetical protein
MVNHDERRRQKAHRVQGNDIFVALLCRTVSEAHGKLRDILAE